MGTITVMICLTGYYFAWRYFKINKINHSIALLILCGLLLRIYVATDPYLHEWDERYHALVAKNLISHPLKPTLYDNPVLPYDYHNWTGNHIWVHKQPFPLWTMAISLSIFGINEFALRIPSIILSALGIFIIFRIGRYLFNDRTGFIAAFLFSIHGLIIELTGGRVATDHYDIFFLFFISTAILLSIEFANSKRQYLNILAGVSIGLAILCKWLPALIVLPIWILILIDSKNFSFKAIAFNFMVLLLVTTIVFLPWQIYIFRNFPLEATWESTYNYMHLTKVLEERGGPFYFHFDNLRILYGELVYLPILWFIYKAVKGRFNYKRWILITWFLIPFLLFSFARTKMQAYTLFTAPSIFIITALFWVYLYRYRKRFKYNWIPVVLLIGLIALPVRYSIERTKAFQIRERHPEWVQEIKELKDKTRDGNLVILNSKRPIETMFYINCAAYPFIPDNKTINRLKSKGYKIITLND